VATANSLIALALKMSGAVGLGQVSPAEDVADALTLLQDMAAQWARQRWLVPHLADVAFTLNGSASYTIGAGGDINVARPDRIEAAYYRLNQGNTPLDWPLYVMDSREQWDRVQLKQMRGLPGALFYDTGYPLGTIWLYPVSPLSSSYELHLSVKDGMGGFSDPTADTGMAPEYNAALMWNLAAILRPYYQLPPEPTITAKALNSLNVIRRTNTQIPEARMPRDLPGMCGNDGGDWVNGLAGVGAAPGFNQVQGFRVGISTLDGQDIVE